MMHHLIERTEQWLDPRRRSRQALWYVVHRYGRRDRRIVKQYTQECRVRKLHLGCGWNLLTGWLNVDSVPRCRHALYLDARRPFYFGDQTFDYVFSEHMIEHIPYNDAVKMLAECHRVLKPGGKIRISTPDLDFLIALHHPDKSTLQHEYVVWSTRTFSNDVVEHNDVFVINNFMRDWGHTFIYDESTLNATMISVGFIDIARYGLGQSKDNALCNLENPTRIPIQFLEMETMTLEGTKAG
jgi:predicted SAM-dependent methyltransferase